MRDSVDVPRIPHFTSGDGDIDEEEFVKVLGYYEIPADEAKYCFRKITQHGQKQVKR